jgi:hypothetical protein
MAPWTFKELLLGPHVGAITSWLDEMGGKRGVRVRGKLRARLIAMRPMEHEQWPGGWTTKLKTYKEVYELRFEVGNIQYRPLFFFGIGRSEITFVFPAIEKGNKFDPKDAPDQAEKLIEDVRNGKRNTQEIDLECLAAD